MSDLTIEALLEKVRTDRIDEGNARVRAIVNRVVTDLFRTVQEMEITPNEFWKATDWLTRLGASGQVGLITAGLGFDRLLDMLEDRRDQQAGRSKGTPRAIEGPLYMPGAAINDYEARIDEPVDRGDILVVEGTVKDVHGGRVAHALVDVWHANELGRYSSFDPDQEPFHLRRCIRANSRGDYRYRTVLPPGYAIPPNSPTSELFTALGRHGNRPAHIHYMISGPGLRTLTTQVNLPGDPFLNDDFAYATRDELVLEVETVSDIRGYESLGVQAPFKRARFDIVLEPALSTIEAEHLARMQRAL